MEREYIVAFVIVLAVITVIGTMSYYGFGKSIDFIKGTTKEITGYGKTEDAKLETQESVQTLINAISNCQKDVTKVGCTCSIENKNSLPMEYRVFFQLQKEKDKDNLLIFAFDNEDKILPVRAQTEALKLKDLKLGMAYWGFCDDCKDGSSSSNYNLYCIFNSESTKNAPIILKGDSDGDWAFPFYNTQGVPFDQLSKNSEWKDYRNIGNILRLSNNKFCFLTTNMLRPFDTKSFKPIPLKKSDDIMVLFKGFEPIIVSDSLDNNLKKFNQLKSQFQACDSSFDITNWRALKDDPSIDTETKEHLRVFTWPIKPSRVKIICAKNSKNQYWLDHIEAPINSQVNSPSDLDVLEVGNDYVILKDKIESYSTRVEDSTISLNIQDKQSFDIVHETYIVVYLGGLKDISVKKGMKLKLGDKIGKLSSNTLNYFVYFVDGKNPQMETLYNSIKSSLASVGIRIQEPLPVIKDNFLHTVRLRPLAKLHTGSTKLLPQQYIGCDDPSTDVNEINSVISFTKELDSIYSRRLFDYGSPAWNELQKEQSTKYQALKL